MAKINTVNVIERTDEGEYSIKSFSDNVKGNKEAEKLFKSIVIEREETIDKNYIVDYLDEGFYEDGNYELVLIHS